MIEVDGSKYEGGGAILRVACALSAVTKKPCRVFNIRKSRPKPGLATQHLLGIQALSQLCNGRLEGDFLGSEEIKFYPGEVSRDRVSVNIPTAGSITLVLQTLIPPCLFAKKPVEIKFNGGATDTFFSPTIDHFRYVFLKILEKMAENGSLPIKINIIKRGYYPEGGAKVEVKIYPVTKNKDTNYQGDRRINTYQLKPLNLIERGEFKKISIFSVASEFLKEKKVAERQLRGVKEILAKLKLPIETQAEYVKTDSAGSSICMVSEFVQTILGSDGLGKLGKPAEQVGRECALQLLEEEKNKACLDRFLTDQILIYLALAKGKNQVRIPQLSSHAQTNIWTIQQFFNGRFEIKDSIISWIPSK